MLNQNPKWVEPAATLLINVFLGLTIQNEAEIETCLLFQNTVVLSFHIDRITIPFIEMFILYNVFDKVFDFVFYLSITVTHKLAK